MTENTLTKSQQCKIKAIVDRYKKDTGYSNCIGSIENFLKEIWPYIEQELDKE